MLTIIEREILQNYNLGRRIVNRVICKSSLIAKSEQAGTDLSGKWDETIFAASDVNGYQEASRILAFVDSKGTKGSFI